MKRTLLAAALVVAAVLGASPRAEAGSPIFERSYYSHAPAKQVEVGPQAHRAPIGPAFSRPQGFAVNSGFRLQRSMMRFCSAKDGSSGTPAASWITIGR